MTQYTGLTFPRVDDTSPKVPTTPPQINPVEPIPGSCQCQSCLRSVVAEWFELVKDETHE